MRIAKVIGTITLNRAHPSFASARLKLVVPQSAANVAGDDETQADPIVAWDELGAGIGSQIAISEGREASQPFHPEFKPVDAYNAAILDAIDIEGNQP